MSSDILRFFVFMVLSARKSGGEAIVALPVNHSVIFTDSQGVHWRLA